MVVSGVRNSCERGQELVLQPRHAFGLVARAALGFEQLLARQLDLALLGHIRAAPGQADEPAIGRIARRGSHLDPAPLSIMAACTHQCAQAALFLQRCRQLELKRRQIVGMQQFAPRRYRAAGNIQAEEFAVRAVDEAHHALRVQHPHRHRQPVGQRTETRLAFGQLTLDTLALGNVHEQDSHPPLVRPPDAERIDRIPALERLGLHFKVDAVACAGNKAVAVEPLLLMLREQVANGNVQCVGGQTGVALERAIGGTDQIIHRLLTVEHHVDDAETGIDVVEDFVIHRRVEKRLGDGGRQGGSQRRAGRRSAQIGDHGCYRSG